MMDQGEDFGIERDSNKITDKGSESTGEMANVLSSIGAANILASRGLKEVFTTSSPPAPLVSLFVPTVAATASEKDSTAAVITTTTAVTPYIRRTRSSRGVVMTSSSPIPINIPSISKEDKGKGIMTEPAKPTKQKIARLHTEGELKMMIDELDRSNEVIAKHLKEYSQAKDVLSLEDKIKLITELAKYQKDLAQIKKYQAQQSKLASKTDRRKFYTSVMRSHAEWKTKDFKGMTFEQIEETFILVWESIQDFVLMDSKLESERFKRLDTLLEKERAKRLKIVEGSEQQSEGNKDVKEKDSDDHDKIINLQQWVVLVRQEFSVDITPSVVKAPIYDWKIFKDKLREVYQIFRVGQAPEAYPYFEAMLKEFDRDDMVTLWKLVKDRFKEELPKSDLEKCLFWPLKVMFEPVATNGLWQFEAPIKSWRLYKSCRVHCLIMKGMIIYMLDDVEYPLPKTTLQKMLDHKRYGLGLILYRAPCAIKGVLRKNTENLNNKIIKLNEELSDCETDLYNYKRGLSQVEARLVEFKNNEIKFCERIRVLERDLELRDNKIENLRNELEEVKKEKESIDFKIENFDNASKDLDCLLGTQRSVKDKTGLGLNEYTSVPPPPAQVYSPPKNDLSWTGLPEFVDDTVIDYSRPTPSIDVSKDVSDEQKAIWKSNSASFSKQRGSVGNVLSKPMISFVKETGCPSVSKVNNTKKSRKPTVKYAEMYRSQRPRGNQRN
ncbi:hypothetical protein Tco_0137762 [Tanacetum coccineum]